MNKILIIRFSALGDVILTTPVISLLQKEFPEAKIFFAIKKHFAEILPHSVTPMVLERKESLFSFRRRLAAAGTYDLVVDLQANLRSRILCLLLKKKKLVRFQKPYLRRLLTILTKKNFLAGTPSVPQRYLNTLRKVLQKLPAAKSLRPVTATEPLPSALKDNLKNKNYFIVAPGSRWFTKKWPLDYFVALAQQICQEKPDFLPVLLGGPDESEDCRILQKNLPQPSLLLAGELSLPQVVTLLQGAEFLVCNDSGLMHLAATTETKIYALFTSTIPEFGFVPLSPHAKILTAADIPCRPCNHKGLARCPRKHYLCGRKLTPDIVLRAISL